MNNQTDASKSESKINNAIIIAIFLLSQYLATVFLRKFMILVVVSGFFNWKSYFDYIIFAPHLVYLILWGSSIIMVIYYLIFKRKWIVSFMLIYLLVVIILVIIVAYSNTFPTDPTWILDLE